MANDAPPAVRPRADVTLKISLAGDPGVGKTSLVRRFVSQTFDENYTPTLGTRISSRRFTMDDPTSPGSPLSVGASVWDIMGSHQFRDLLKEAFFLNASAVLLVADVTRPESLYNLPQWYEIVASVAGPVPTTVLVNKADLKAKAQLPMDAVERVCKDLGWSYLTTSAKTGENVQTAFENMAAAHVRGHRPIDPSATA